MYFTSFNRVAQIIILMCFISFAGINCEEYFQFLNQFKNAPLRAKRSQLSLNAGADVAEKLLKYREHQAKDSHKKHSPGKLGSGFDYGK
uniref:Uncharacterized protein n=1 Tax=Strongyloides papillosus TaxID=174720 RepID=A0A0N5C7U4_STREA